VVLADSLYGESGDFISELEKLHLKYVVAIRSKHGVWLPPGQRVRYTNWRPFERVFSNGDSQTRYIREIVFGQRGRIRYYHLTTDPQTLPAFEHLVHHDQSGGEHSENGWQHLWFTHLD